MIPDAIEHAAPTRKATPVRNPRSTPYTCVPATAALFSTNATTAPMTTAPTTARIAIVVYWRRMKATAPSKIVPATSCISFVPVSRARTSRAR